jgi:hypothetical protein
MSQTELAVCKVWTRRSSNTLRIRVAYRVGWSEDNHCSHKDEFDVPQWHGSDSMEAAATHRNRSTPCELC